MRRRKEHSLSRLHCFSARYINSLGTDCCPELLFPEGSAGFPFTEAVLTKRVHTHTHTQTHRHTDTHTHRHTHTQYTHATIPVLPTVS